MQRRGPPPSKNTAHLPETELALLNQNQSSLYFLIKRRHKNRAGLLLPVFILYVDILLTYIFPLPNKKSHCQSFPELAKLACPYADSQ